MNFSGNVAEQRRRTKQCVGGFSLASDSNHIHALEFDRLRVVQVLSPAVASSRLPAPAAAPGIPRPGHSAANLSGRGGF